MKCKLKTPVYKAYNWKMFMRAVIDDTFLGCPIYNDINLGGYWIRTPYGDLAMTPLGIIVILDEKDKSFKTMLEREFEGDYEIIYEDTDESFYVDFKESMTPKERFIYEKVEKFMSKGNYNFLTAYEKAAEEWRSLTTLNRFSRTDPCEYEFEDSDDNDNLVS